jgi:hypothetical protein
MTTLHDQLLAINPGTWTKIPCAKDELGLRLADMYGSPNLTAAQLMELVELFGTKDIDVDGYSQSGCETCDWGSSYGHDIIIRNPTKNVSEFADMKLQKS